ncbi:sensor histidine kinase [Caldalkalibacillus salinus]|uniref:ATP-binding protein n=1 Tax=Caldalkalibacillus salinus TaxID=2803787 RepID=UPI00192200F5|nr:sensor histidine kinase [Caldalkalibacillus salinus]
MSFIKDVLLHLFFIIFPILLYQSLWLDKFHATNVKQNRYLIGLLAIFSILLCMTFPIVIDQGLSVDLRAIPIIVGTLYGGMSIGISSASVMFAYEFFQFGSQSMLPTAIAFSLYIWAPLLMTSKWFRLGKRKKIQVALGLGVLQQLASFSAIAIHGKVNTQSFILGQENIDFLLYSGIAHTLSLLLVIMLCEHVREMTFIRGQLAASEKLNMVSELAASVAHEVRNPLTVVRGFIQLLNDPTDQTKQNYSKLVISELDRAERMITEYLNLAKPQTEVREVLEVGDLLYEVSSIISSYAVIRNVSIHTDINQDLYVFGDPPKLKQVFMNVVKNAIESHEDVGDVWIHAFQKRQYVIVQIKDTGSGMSKEQLNRLGQPFYTTKDKGTGIGLMVTYRIIQSLRGRLRLTSEPGQGTTVTIFLPTAKKF